MPQDNNGLFDPVTADALQQQQIEQQTAAIGGNAATRANFQAINQGLGNLFPSPAVQQARKQQAALAGAQVSQNPGESDLDYSIRQLQAQRDAVAPLNPQAASQMNTQMLKLGQMKLEQSRLIAQDQRETNQDQRESESESDRHNAAQQKLSDTKAVGINYHLIGPNSKDLGSFDLSDPDQKVAYLKAKAANPGSSSLSDEAYSQHLDKMAEINAAAEAKARYGLGGMNGFGDEKVQDLLASMASKGINLPTGFRSKDQMYATFQGLLKKYDGLTTDDIADLVGKGIVDFKATTKATQTAAGILGRVQVASGELDAMVPIAQDASDHVPRSDFVPYNRLTQMVKAGTSSPEQKRLYIATQSILNTYDVLAARGGTDAKKREAQHQMLETADGPDAYNAALKMIVTESQVARAGALGAIKAGTYGLDEKRALESQAPNLPSPTNTPDTTSQGQGGGLPQGWSVVQH